MANSADTNFHGRKNPSSSQNAKLLAFSNTMEMTEQNSKATNNDSQPQKIHDFDTIGMFAVVISLLCLVLAVLVVTPNHWLSWKLGYPGQIVVVGFLLSTMNLCMQTVLPPLFLRLEAKWGRSTLQNYDALLRNRFLDSNISNLWRIVLVFLTILPLGLSVAYKRFLGGTSDIAIKVPSFQNHNYGTAFPSLGDFTTMNSSLFLMMHPVAGLQVQASIDESFTSLQYPAAYGYNVLLLNDSSAAMLDIPMPNYVSEIQSQLRKNESWYINATVRAYVAQYNESVTALARGKTSYWNDTVDFNAGYQEEHRNTLSSKWLYYESLSFGSFPLMPTNDESSTVFLGAFQPDTSLTDLIDTYDPYTQSQDYMSFSKTAMAFSIRREMCSGCWKVDLNGIKLLKGTCSNDGSGRVRSKAIADTDSIPFAIDTLPILCTTASPFFTTRKSSPWTMPILAASTVSMYWSLAVRRLAPDLNKAFDYDLLYSPIEESVVSSNSVMSSYWLLYVILAIQPVVTLAAFVEPC